jgi:hypothetical protein
MASGHVNRIKRPNTWLHRPMLQNVKKALANPEPSTHGAKRTNRGGLTMSVVRGRPEVTDRSGAHDSLVSPQIEPSGSASGTRASVAQMRLSLLNLNGSSNALWRIDVAERACPGVG